jgi:hypothetical protein
MSATAMFWLMARKVTHAVDQLFHVSFQMFKIVGCWSLVIGKIEAYYSARNLKYSAKHVRWETQH